MSDDYRRVSFWMDALVASGADDLRAARRRSPRT